MRPPIMLAPAGRFAPKPSTLLQPPVHPAVVRAARQQFAQGLLGLYILPFLPPQLTALQTGVDCVLQLDKDLDFELDRIVSSSTGLFSVYFQDSSRGLPLMESLTNPIFGENISGPAGLPYWLPRKMRIVRGTRITATFADRSNALNTIQLCFLGKKVS